MPPGNTSDDAGGGVLARRSEDNDERCDGDHDNEAQCLGDPAPARRRACTDREIGGHMQSRLNNEIWPAEEPLLCALYDTNCTMSAEKWPRMRYMGC